MSPLATIGLVVLVLVVYVGFALAVGVFMSASARYGDSEVPGEEYGGDSGEEMSARASR